MLRNLLNSVHNYEIKALPHFFLWFLFMLTGIFILYSCRKDEMRVETISVTNISINTATALGNIIDLGEGAEQHGHCWGMNATPTIRERKTVNGIVSRTGTFTSQLSGIEPGNTYHIRAYMQNGREVVYGKDLTFTTLNGKFDLTTAEVTNISFISATSGGIVPWINGDTVLLKGVCWNNNSTVDLKTKAGFTANGPGPGSFTSELTGLIPGRTYIVKAYAITSSDTIYASSRSFTTLDGLTTTEVTNISFYSAMSGGHIGCVNSDTVLSRGVCWDTITSVSLNVKAGFTANGSGTGNFVSEITGLIPGKMYYVKAYAISDSDTIYAKARGFTTPSGKGTLTTATVSSIKTTTASTGGNLTFDGGSTVTARGVCYGTIENPTIADNITSDGAGTGSFTSSLSGLIPNTTYYVRAYATNAVTTIYGNQISFLSKGLPEVTTYGVNDVLYSTAICGGFVSSDWGFAVTARGICWSTSKDPTTFDSKTIDGSGLGSFTSNLSSLTQKAVYYARAYATNSLGTSYGVQRTFTVPAVVEVTSFSTGKVWIDRNLGATSAATDSRSPSQAHGYRYQWGRGSDGHQLRSSTTTATLSSSDTPGHGYFIINPYGSHDWRSTQNDNLWQGVNGINNPCPQGYRLPTDAEWQAEIKGFWFVEGAVLAPSYYPLKLTLSEYRDFIDGSGEGSLGGYYWSSTVSGTSAKFLFFSFLKARTGTSNRANGYSVRCIKD